MAKINFNNGRVEDYTIVLATRDYRHLGQLTGIKSDSVQSKTHLNSANELSFSIYKYDLLRDETGLLSDEEFKRYQIAKTILWNQIVDFRLVWVKELDEYYEIKVSVEDAAETTKTVTATSLCEAELGQRKIDSLEINSESDILRDDYEITTFYNKTNAKASLLNRVLADKAPDYTIEYVEPSLCGLQRTFSVSGTTIYDFLTGEVSEQFNCLFVFNSTKRSISVYDLYTTCRACGHREDFYDVCPKCGSTNLKYHGEDTTIFVDKMNLTDSIRFETNANEVKNSLRLVAGDDLMTATIRLLNQNGSNYLYYMSDFQKDDMPKELTNKLSTYQVDYDSKTEEYQKAMSAYYDATDEILYLKSGMMPTVKYVDSVDDINDPKQGVIYVCKSGSVYVYDGSKLVLQEENAEYYTNLVPSADIITASSEAKKLTATNLSPMAISSVTTSTSVATVNSAMKNYAKVFVKSGYVKIDIVDGATFTYKGEHTAPTALETYRYGEWTGAFKITNYSDEEDVVTTEKITVMVYDKFKEFTEQKILKQLATEDDEGSVFDVLAIDDLTKFKNALTLYGLNRLTSFYEAIQGALDALAQLNQGTEEAELYEDLYLPYYQKLQACQSEIDVRQKTIDETQKILDDANEVMTEIQSKLNIKTYLGDKLYSIYCSYLREDSYENSNYISDGLSNVELINKAKEFLEAAKKELKRVAEPQITISSSLKNFLVLDEFKPILKYFELGNWIRIKVENEIYRLKLISYSINFGNMQQIDVEFSNISKIKDFSKEANQIIQSAKSTATSIGFIAKQAEKGNFAKSEINDWIQNGLNSALINVKSNNGNVVQYDNGILCRNYNDETETYDPKQLKIIYNNILLTQDGWKTCSLAVGEHSYTVYNPGTNQNETYVGYGITADFLAGKHITGKTIIGGKIYSTNYSDGSYGRKAEGTFIDLENGHFSFAAGGLKYNGSDLIISERSIADAISNIKITAENITINAVNIHGEITNEQIKSVDATKITGKIKDSQIEGLSASKLTGKITNSQIDSVPASKITGKVSSSQIESVKAEQITGSIVADSVKASNISGTISSNQIADTLSNKNVTGTFEGNVTATSVKTTSNGVTYNTVSGEFTVGNMTLKFVNGLLVSAIPVTE